MRSTESRSPREITTLRLLGIGAGSLSLAVAWALYNTFMPLFLGEFIASRGWRGVVMGLDNIISIVLIPLVGVWSDRVDGPWGKRLPFLLVAMPLSAVLFAALPFATSHLVTLLAVDVVFLLTITAYRAPLIALLPDHVAPRGRAAANGIITLMGASGGAIGLLLIAPLFDEAQWLPFAVAAAIALVCLVVVLVAAERHPANVTIGSVEDDTPLLPALVRDAASLARPPLRGASVLLLAVFFCFLGYSALEAQFSTYATQTLGMSGGRAGSLLGAASLAYVAAAVPAGRLAKRFGSANVMRVGATIMAAALIVASIVENVSTLPVVLAIGGAAWALVLVPAYPLVVNQGGEAQNGFFTGMYYLFGSVASIAGPALIGATMDVFGNRALFFSVAIAMLLGAALVGVARRRSVE
ncbi:MAG TPA: MFS transporter [Trueperaceae bacterium]|nr:MFS transporter [Trueperaceae bacterium]